ncbi:MAG: hypothetical protein KGL39_22915 [Patescibacteria group bacterium]|nr:hypothetical protein [Patescibacteria group bacterium]
MPTLVIQFMQVVPFLVSAAQDAKPIIDAAKKVIAGWVAGGLISVDIQNQLHSYLDGLMHAVLAGEVLPEFQVQPDPQ